MSADQTPAVDADLLMDAQDCVDSTERSQHENARRESDQRFRSVFDQSKVGMALTDTQRRFVRVNASFAEWLGYTPAELETRSLADVTYSEDQAITDENAARVGAGSAVTYEKRYVRKDGTIVWGRANVSPLRDANGRPAGLMGIVEDITERRQLQERVLQSQKMEALGQLAGGVAHDFNNLLTVISACATFALEDLPETVRTRDDVAEILAASRRAAALTRQLLAFSRREMLHPEIMDVNATVEGMAKTLGRLIGEHIALDVQTNALEATVEADPHQVEQVVVNLVVNARDAIEDAGTIQLDTASVARTGADGAERQYVVIAVSDDGVGIAPDIRNRIFEPFFTTKPAGKGTGLGLSTVHGIVEQTGGFIEVDSTLGLGTTFRVFLPLCDARHLLGDRTESENLRGSGTVLLVEDESALRAVARRVLAAHGYTVLEARHGGDALDVSAHRGERIHVLVTDVVMPEVGGRELARRIRRQRPNIRVLYVTGYTDDELLRKGILEPGAQLLRKPFTPVELVRAVGQLMRAAKCALPLAPTPASVP